MVTRVKCAKTVSVTISKMYFFYIHTNPVVQNICDTNTLMGIMFYKHLLLTFPFSVDIISRA